MERPARGGGQREGPGLSRPQEYDWERLLIERAKTDPEAFGAIYDEYADRIYAYIWRRVGDRQVAEDLTSETFFRALRAIKGYQHSGQTILAWLYRIAANQVADHFRASRSNLPLEEAEVIAERDETGPEAMALQADQQRTILAAIQKLSPDQQDVVLLRFSGGLRLKEIAETVGKTENAVKQLLFRALGNLKGRLMERGGP